MTNPQDATNPTHLPHDGSACPVSPGTRVRVWFRGPAGSWKDGEAERFDWKSAREHKMSRAMYATDIIAYAILEPDWAVEGPKLAEALQKIADQPRTVEMIDPTDVSEGCFIEAYDAMIQDARTALSRIKGEEG